MGFHSVPYKEFPGSKIQITNFISMKENTNLVFHISKTVEPKLIIHITRSRSRKIKSKYWKSYFLLLEFHDRCS